jgi:uncharacterized membrane-anchored protein YitT (DUF2179 family)
MGRKLIHPLKLPLKTSKVLLTVKNWVFIALGVLSAGFGLKSFLLPNHFIDGGATGISLLLSQVTQLPFSFIIIIINLPFLALGYKQYGKSLFWSAFVAIVALSMAVTLIPYPEITEDKLLVASFGGFFLGAGIGMAMRGGGVLDGTEILALTMSQKISASIGDVILVFNIIVFFVEGIEEYTAITIVSNHHAEEISTMIIEQFGRGITTYKGSKGHGNRGTVHRETDIIYTVVTRLEVSKIKNEILAIDPDVFMVIHSVREIRGGMIKKRPLHIH